MRKPVLFATATVAFGLIIASAKADNYGCAVLLCTAPGAGDWRKIAECVGPVSTALAQASVGVPWPTCPEAAILAAAAKAPPPM